MRPAPLADDARQAPRAPATRARLLLVFGILIILVLAGWLALRLWTGTGRDPEQLLAQARAAWSAGHLDQAEATLATLSELSRPATVPERLLRAQVAKERGKIEDAV